MTGSGPRVARFDTAIESMGRNTGIVVPPEVIEQLGAGRRPPVLVDLDGYQYRSTVAVLGGRYLISVSAAVRAATGLGGGDPVAVTLTVAEAPREVDVPPDLAAALAAEEPLADFFAGLSNSMRRYHVDHINGAKSPETRQRRIDKALEAFRAGKQR